MKYKYLILKPFVLLLILIGAGWIYIAYSQGGWEQMEDMPTARGQPGCCFLNGKIYVIGGWGVPSGNPAAYACTEVYDTSLNEWTVRANAKEELTAHSINIIKGKIYAIGNYNESTVEEYDPVKDEWTFKNNMPEIRWMHTSCVYNDTIYVFGGHYPWESVSTARIYDPQTDTWNSIPDMTYARDIASCCVYNNKIYVFGGTDFSLGVLRSVEVYDPAKDTWKNLEKIPKATCGHFTILHNGKIYLFGGDNGLDEINPLKHVYEYNPETDEWTRMKDMPFKRSMTGGIKVGKYVYLCGGFPEPTRGNMSSEVWRFNLDSLKELPTSIRQPYKDANNSITLHQNYPNPFSGSTLIRYDLTEPGEVQLEVFNILGEKITTLVNESRNPGSYEVTWNAEGVQPGIYFCKLKVAGFEKVSKLIVLH